MRKFYFTIFLVLVMILSKPLVMLADINEDYDEIARYVSWSDIEGLQEAIKKNKKAVNHNNGAIILEYANYPKDPQILKLLLDNGATTNALEANTNKNALHILLGEARDYNLDIIVPSVKMLVDKGINVNQQESNYGYTPLHIAAKSDYLGKEIFEILLSAKNVDVNIKCNPINEYEDGAWTPIFFVVSRPNDPGGTNKDIVKLLIDKKADVKATTLDQSPVIKRKWTLLHICAETKNDQVDVFKVLFENGCSDYLEAQTTNEMLSPLHVAMLSESPRICQYLLEKGASYESKNSDGVTVLRHAKGAGTDKHLKSAEVVIKWAKEH